MQLNLRLEHKLRRKLKIKPIILLRSQILRYKHFYILLYDFAIAGRKLWWMFWNQSSKMNMKFLGNS